LTTVLRILYDLAMANRKVTLLRQCKTDNGWRRYPAVIGKNGRVKPNYVIVAGEEREFKEGYYQTRSYVGSRTVIRNVGDRASDALAALDREVRLLAAKESAVAAGVQIMEEPDRVTLSNQLTKFVRVVGDRGAEVAADVYRLSADEFLFVTGRIYSDQITSDDILHYHNSLRKRGCSARTIHNRHMNLLAFLRYCGLDVDVLAPSVPKYEKTVPEIYDDESIRKFFASLTDDRHRALFELLLSTGLREQEAMYLEWPDLSESTSTITIHSKPQYKFKIKDKEERSVPVSTSLLTRLEAIRGAGTLVFPTKSGKPDTKLLRLLKNLVRKARLNCGTCKPCRERNECEQWYLHRFRATYCTKLLRSGMDLRTVQQMMGHSDLASTMRYLRPAEGKEMQTKINSIKWV
jgi:integrase